MPVQILLLIYNDENFATNYIYVPVNIVMTTDIDIVKKNRGTERVRIK